MQKQIRKGIFITCEGIDRSGKSTQIELIRNFFKDRDYEVILTREPGGTDISEKIREILLDNGNAKMGEITEMMLYASARAQLVHEVIKPCILAGKVVICDRFVDSSYAYQGFGRGIDTDIIMQVNAVALSGIEPDITFFFDIEPAVTLKRIRSDEADRMEKENIDFHNRVYSGYKALAAMYPERIKTIKSNRQISEVYDDVCVYLNKLII